MPSLGARHKGSLKQIAWKTSPTSQLWLWLRDATLKNKVEEPSKSISDIKPWSICTHTHTHPFTCTYITLGSHIDIKRRKKISNKNCRLGFIFKIELSDVVKLNVCKVRDHSLCDMCIGITGVTWRVRGIMS